MIFKFTLQYYVSVHCNTFFIVGEQKALEEGGKLYGKTVYLFANTERKYAVPWDMLKFTSLMHIYISALKIFS